MDSIILMMIFFFVAFILLIIFKNNREDKIMMRLLDHQASKRNGSIMELDFNKIDYYKQINIWGYYARMKFSYNEYTVFVMTRPGLKGILPETRVNILLPCTVSHKIFIYKNLWSPGFKKISRMNDSYTEIPEFDKVFRIKEGDELVIKKLIDVSIQNKLIEIKHNIYILIEGNQVSVYVKKMFKNNADYDQLIEVALAIIDKIALLEN